MASPVLQFKRGVAANVGLASFRDGEPGFVTDTFDFYIGADGTAANQKFFGSSRYWTKETSSTGSSVRLVEGTTNGTNYVALKAPNSLAADLTYTLPGLQGASSTVLTNDGSGNLSWSSGSNNSTFTGITTFSDTTDSSTSTNGAVIIAGGLGVAKSLNVGSNFSVAGISTFVGNVTFQGGTINLGDSNTDNVVFAADVNSNIIPNTDNTYDFGNSAQRWRNANFSGIVTAPTIDASGGTVTIGTLQVNGNSNFNGNVTIGGTAVSIAASTLSVADKDIILGYTQFPTDTTANHGGISIASTEGTPLISMAVAGINTLPDTYKQIMWIKSGTFSGLGTDIFMFNYGVGIGSTQVPNGVRLAVGGVQVTDNTVTATNGSFTNLTGTLTGTISTATRATLVDTTTAPTGTFYPGLFSNSTGAASTTVYVDAGISYVSNTDTLTLTGDIAVNGGDVTTSSATATVFNTNATTVNAFDAATALVVGATSGIATIRNTTFSLPNATTVAVDGTNPTLSGTSTGTLTLFNTNLTGVNAFGAATALVMGAATGITTVRNKLTVGGNLEIDGNNIQASDGNTNITLTSNTLTTFAGDIKVTGNDIQSSSATALTLSGADVTVAGNLTVSGNLIKSSTGATAITLAANDVTVSDDLTVQGNLYVSGSTTQVNTASLTVEDRTIDLGIVDGAAPASTTTWDLGVLFNYYTAGAAKKSAVIWEHVDTRFKFASLLAADTNGTDNNTPQLTVTTFAPIEVAELWINNTCTGGSSQVIACSGSNLILQNILIDAGTF